LNEELNLSLPRKPDNGTSDLAYLFLGDEAFALRKVNLSLPRKPDNGTSDLAYLFLGDEAFALRKDLLKSFSQKQLTNERSFFNCRLSRARRVIENTLGIMALRFRVSHTEINLKLENRNSCLVLLCSTQLFASLV